MSILYQPADGTAGDFIPFYREGVFHLFHLQQRPEGLGGSSGIPWRQVVTADFVNFEDWGEALPAGEMNDPDWSVFTGCVLERKEEFHIFYTGHNGRFEKSGKPVETILHATSRNLRTWVKDNSFSFPPPVAHGYAPNDWRDPFVFWNAATRDYWMLIAAKRRALPARHGGCVALAVSRDLKEWTLRQPLWAPDRYGMCECPDLFRIGSWWYLLFSTFTDRRVTHYRMARSLEGPWMAPADDTLDGPAWYAGKTACDGRRRFAFGWLSGRLDNRDDRGWSWGGTLVVHQIEQRRDGTLAVHAPDSLLRAFPLEVASTPEPVIGTWVDAERETQCVSPTRWSATRWSDLPDTALVEWEFILERNTQECGLLLRMDRALERYYQLRFEPGHQRMLLDYWPRDPGSPSFLVERSLSITPGKVLKLRLIVDGPCVVVYVNDETAMSGYMCQGRTGGGLGFFVAEGSARFRRIIVRRPKTLWE